MSGFSANGNSDYQNRMEFENGSKSSDSFNSNKRYPSQCHLQSKHNKQSEHIGKWKLKEPYGFDARYVFSWKIAGYNSSSDCCCCASVCPVLYGSHAKGFNRHDRGAFRGVCVGHTVRCRCGAVTRLIAHGTTTLIADISRLMRSETEHSAAAYERTVPASVDKTNGSVIAVATTRYQPSAADGHISLPSFAAAWCLPYLASLTAPCWASLV